MSVRILYPAVRVGNALIVKYLETKSRLESQGVDVVGGTAAEFAAFLREEIAKCASVRQGCRHQSRWTLFPF